MTGTVKKQDVLVYGAGNFFKTNREILEEDYCIKAVIDKNRQGFLEDLQIIRLEEYEKISHKKMLIMVENVKFCFEIIRDLLNHGIDHEKIVLGMGLCGFYADKYDEIKALPSGKIRVRKNGIAVAVRSVDEWNNVYATLVGGCYDYKINNGKKDVVIDVGMNVGDTALYFLANANVEKVYGFEPFQGTFLDARENLGEYLENRGRLEIFQYGLSDVTEKRTITFNEDMSCGLSTKSAEMVGGGIMSMTFTMTTNWQREKKKKRK